MQPRTPHSARAQHLRRGTSICLRPLRRLRYSEEVQPCSSDSGAADCVLRWAVCCAYHCVGLGPTAACSAYLQGVAIALARMDKLCSELPFHCYCLGESPLSHALCDGGDAALDVAQLRTPVFGVTASALHRLDGGQRTGTAASRLLCSGFLRGKCDLHISNSRAH